MLYNRLGNSTLWNLIYNQVEHLLCKISLRLVLGSTPPIHTMLLNLEHPFSGNPQNPIINYLWMMKTSLIRHSPKIKISQGKLQLSSKYLIHHKLGQELDWEFLNLSKLQKCINKQWRTLEQADPNFYKSVSSNIYIHDKPIIHYSRIALCQRSITWTASSQMRPARSLNIIS